jgi:hypothetical protein
MQLGGIAPTPNLRDLHLGDVLSYRANRVLGIGQCCRALHLQPTFIAKLSGLPRYFRISDMPTSIFATSPIAVLARSTVRLVAFIQHPPVGGFDGIQIPTPRYLDVEIMTSDEPQCLAPCRPRYAASRTLTCDL